MNPIQSSTNVKRLYASYCVKETLVFNNKSKPRFASAPALDRIRASTRDLNGSDPNLHGYSIQRKLVRIAEPNWIGYRRSRVYARPICSCLGSVPNGSAPCAWGLKYGSEFLVSCTKYKSTSFKARVFEHKQEMAYLFRAFNISMVTRTDNAIVIGSKLLKTLQSTFANADGSKLH